jgi:hypothetical protein
VSTLKRAGIERKTVLGLRFTDFLEQAERKLRIALAEPSRSRSRVGRCGSSSQCRNNIAPYRTKLLLLPADAEPIRQSFKRVLREQEVERLIALFRKIAQLIWPNSTEHLGSRRLGVLLRNRTKLWLCCLIIRPAPAQPVDATQALDLSAGVSNCKVSRGRSFN